VKEDNLTLEETKKLCLQFQMQLGVCRSCDHPYIWKFGQLTKEPGDCGRFPCMVTLHPELAIEEEKTDE